MTLKFRYVLVLFATVSIAGCASGTMSPVSNVQPMREQIAVRRPASATAGRYSVLYAFQGASGSYTDGSEPNGPPIFDARGDIFGTTQSGGGTSCYEFQGCGTIFELTPSGKDQYTESIVYDFDYGALPTGSPAFDESGNLYATAPTTTRSGAGVVVQLEPAGSGFQLSNTFAFNNADGIQPGSPMFVGSTMFVPVEGGGSSNAGVVAAFTTPGFSESTAYTFKGGDDGEDPVSLTADSSGALYGVTVVGGRSDAGTVFKFVPGQNGGTETVLFSFPGGSSGEKPQGSLVLDGGDVYGTAGLPGGGGIVFALTPTKVGYREKILHTFAVSDQFSAPTSLILHGKTLYGVTQEGGTSGNGEIFKMSRSGSGYKDLYDFPNATEGTSPSGIVYRDGALYGAATFGGNQDAGTIFKYSL